MSLLSDDFPMIMEVEAGMPQNCPPVSVAFGLYPMLDSKRTQEAGHDVYKDVEHVKIAIPGDRNSLFFQPSQPAHRKRFPQAYAAFQQRDVTPIDGMRIEEWAPISRALAYNLRAANIHTVEALAAVHEGNIDRIGANGRELREKARAWLLNAKTGAAAAQLAAEKQELLDQLASMQAQLNALAQQPQQKPAAPAEAPVFTPAPPVPGPVNPAAARRPRA